MIKIEHVVLPSGEQMEFIIEGMRNPMNSWDKSDSNWVDIEGVSWWHIGDNDFSLMHRLANAGNSDRKFMRMMPVMVRITAPLYWWKEFDTYKVGTVANSCSTMHKIQAKEFTFEDFSAEHLMDWDEDFNCDCLINEGTSPDGYPCGISPMGALHVTIAMLNKARVYYLELERQLKEDTLTDDERKEIVEYKEDYWWQMIQLLPSSYNQTRNVMLNYEVLKNIHDGRWNHKLDEWREFCKWIETLPYAALITGKEIKNEKDN